MPGGVELNSSKFHPRAPTTYLSDELLSRSSFINEVVQVWGWACLGCDGFVLSAATVSQSELGQEKVGALNSWYFAELLTFGFREVVSRQFAAPECREVLQERHRRQPSAFWLITWLRVATKMKL